MALGEFNETGIDSLVWLSDHDKVYTKLTPRDAAYRKSTDISKVCGNCRYFLEGGACKRVDGYIEPDFVCDLWEATVPKVSNIVSKYIINHSL
jgi:hypothetical protein